MQHTSGATSPTHSSSSSSSVEEVPNINALKEAVHTTNTLSAHIALIDALRKTAELTQLRQAIETASNGYPLPQSTWISYLTDEATLATTPQSRRQLLSLHTRALSDFATPALHAQLLVFASTLLGEAEITEKEYKQFIHNASEYGAGYDQDFKTLCSDLPHIEHIFEQPPPEHQVFEQRLLNTPPAHAGSAVEARLTAYLFYARFAEDYPIFAISIYERALSEAFFSPELWRRYDTFLARMNHPSRSIVLERACRVLPNELELWRRAVTIADVPALVNLIDRVKPFVMKSHDLATACRLTKDVWTRFLALGCPAEVRGQVEGCLEFNIFESVEWASACTHAAAVMTAYGDYDKAVKLMEDLVAIRSEARWWLAYAGLMHGESQRHVYERAIKSVGSAGEVQVIRDAWEIFEVSLGGEGVMDRMKAVCDVTLLRDGERMKGVADAVEHAERRHGKPAKRRRAARGKPDVPRKEKGGTATGKEKASEVGENGVAKMEEDEKEDATIAKSVATSDPAGSSKQEGKPDTKAVKTPGTGGVEPKTIFLNNLPFAVTEGDLEEVFAFAGTIKQIRLPKRSDGATKGIAYIEFSDEGAVAKALTQHNKPIKGRAVWVRQSKPPRRTRKAARRGVPRFAGLGAPRGGRRRALILPHGDDEKNGKDGTDRTDVDVVMDDAEKVSGLRQDDFRKLFLGDA